MKLFSLFLLAVACVAQTLTPTGPAIAKPGTAVTVSVVLAGTDNSAGLQWQMTAAPATTMTATAAASATAAVKTLHTNTTNNIALLVGMNTNRIAPGEVARYTFTMPSNSVTVSLSNPLAADLSGAAILLKAGAPLTVNVQSSEDINGDGRIDTIDVMISVDQIQGRATCGTSDVNGDGKCDLYDTMRIISAALGAGG